MFSVLEAPEILPVFTGPATLEEIEVPEGSASEQAHFEAWEDDQFLERDLLEERQRIAAECVEYTSGISSHVAFDKLHDFISEISCHSRPSYHVATLKAELWLAAKNALCSDENAVLWEFYKLYWRGAADGIPSHVMKRSQHWYSIRSKVGQQILRRGLTNYYFKNNRSSLG
jgi:hypothetical protein